MNRTLRHLLLFVLIGLSGSAFAQEILGTVIDQKKEPVINASVRIMQGGILKAGTITDYDGKYSAKPLDPGMYDVTVSYTGKKTQTITGVVVSPGDKTELNFTLTTDQEGHTLVTAVVKAYKKPLIDKYKNNTILTGAEIRTKPTTNTTDLVALTPGVYQSKRGADISSDGGRTTGNVYIIDGVQVQGSTGINMAQGSTEQLEVIASGIPANVGDVSGAVINITSTGPKQKTAGNIRAQTSLDGYNNNLISASIGGPVFKRTSSSDSTRKESVMGYAVSADYYDDHNRNPSYNSEYVTKGDVLNQLRANPLKIVSDNSGQPVYNRSSEYVTADQLTQTKQPPHNETKEIRLNGKLDFKLSDNMTLAAGGNFGYTKQDLYNRSRNLFAPEATPVQNTYNGRGFLRFRQKFGKQGSFDTGKHSIISNAYYTVQIDYQKLYDDVADPKFKRDFFDYAYIGKFNKTYQDRYFASQHDSVTGKTATILLLTQPTGINFTRSEANPILANYTTQYYNSLNENLPTAITQLQAKNALANGDEPNYTYGLFYSPGATQYYYQNYNSNQYALTVDAAFDLKAGGIKHGIEFGLYYQQRIIKSYTVQPNLGGAGTQSLWQQMRQLVSSIDNGNLKLDKTNPITRVNGVNYTYNPTNGTYYDPSGNVASILPSPRDTIFYNYKNVAPTAFDLNLRKKLGLGLNDNINVDALDPSTFSLGMFSADELLNSGKSFVNYYGYTYDGKAQNGTVNFNDFWTAKDANGNYTRPIGAFSPNYIAGYLLDKFEYKNISFNVGLRVERYSANTKVLKDPYSLYGTQDIAQTLLSDSLRNPNGHHPSNLSGNAVVYVDNNNSKSKNIIGYRDGNNWYDAAGNYIANPAVLKEVSGGLDPQPLLVNKTKITDTGFNPNLSFTDYNPQVTLQPRIQISFPISEFSKFSAHYDIYVQRPYPTSLGTATAADYYFLTSNSNQIINNANLRSQKTYDYELGFDQVIGKKAVLKINGFYKERKDMITVTPYLYAYPTTYYTYGNRDFSTTKGLKAFYEMRATNNLSMSIAYTLQFAEGTGSSYNSNNGGSGGQIQPQGLLQSFIEAGLPNLRFVLPLDVDSRHQIVGNFDYRYGDDEGPVVQGKHIFQNAGINFIVKTRSGEPWTRNAQATGNTIIGAIGGNRLPWHFSTDVRLNKDFAFSFGKKQKDAPVGVKAMKVHKLTTFIYFQNLLNTKEVLGVYGYTGRPDDNGYLSSPYGQQAIPVQTNPQSYIDLYKVSGNMSDPNKLNYARTINFGLEYNF